MKDINDMLARFISDSFAYLEQKVTLAAVAFIDNLSSTYLIIYAVYFGLAVLMCFS